MTFFIDSGNITDDTDMDDNFGDDRLEAALEEDDIMLLMADCDIG